MEENRITEEQFNDAYKRFEKYQTKELDMKTYEKAERKANKLGEQMSNFKLLLSMVADNWNGVFKIPKLDLAIIIGAIIYVASPIDAIPDFFPFLGWLDDISIVSIAVIKLADIIEKYKAFKNSQE